ncbi:MAG: type II secretion system protein GspG [Verrucomicrobiota bacterium]
MPASSPRRRSGFTLIEMLATITIIVILTGLVLAGTRFLKDKQNRSKAEIQLRLLAKACEAFKMDNGAYPCKDDNTSADGRHMTNELFNDLYWDSNRNSSGPKTDMEQKIHLAELDPDNNKQGWIEGIGQAARIIDPWGNEYFYRKGVNAQNPDFDLWSAGKDGKTNPDNPKDKVNRDDVRNL